MAVVFEKPKAKEIKCPECGQRLVTDDIAVNPITRAPYYWCVNRDCRLFIHRSVDFEVILQGKTRT